MRDLEESLRDAVLDLADGAPLTENLATVARARGRRIRRRRRTALGAFVVVMFAAVAVPYVALRREAPQPVVEPAPTVTVTPSVLTRALPGFSIKSPYRLPGGATVSMLTLPGADDSKMYVSLDRSTGRYRQLAFAYDPLGMSADGKLFAGSTGSGKVRVLDAADRTVDTIGVRMQFDIDSKPEWSPDGSRLLLPTPDGFAVYDVATKSHRVFENSAIRYFCPDLCYFTWLPNGREVAVGRRDDNVPRSEARAAVVASADIYSADTGKLVRSIPMTGVPASTDAWSPDGRSVLVRVQDEDFSTSTRIADTTTGALRGDPISGQALFLGDGRILAIGSRHAELFTADGIPLEEATLPRQFNDAILTVTRN
ncbi:WD40 repeat domain-containing protein [Actinoplanes sp. NPDC023801]|uniref:WD40 repeat domain-containing protein n=1 Tax=Actinoplanes sp. NPDC023801 TaxID=3154595 RepID=UPI0033CCAD1B